MNETTNATSAGKARGSPKSPEELLLLSAQQVCRHSQFG